MSADLASNIYIVSFSILVSDLERAMEYCLGATGIQFRCGSWGFPRFCFWILLDKLSPLWISCHKGRVENFSAIGGLWICVPIGGAPARRLLSLCGVVHHRSSLGMSFSVFLERSAFNAQEQSWTILSSCYCMEGIRSLGVSVGYSVCWLSYPLNPMAVFINQ